jgi:hypothetical protein
MGQPSKSNGVADELSTTKSFRLIDRARATMSPSRSAAVPAQVVGHDIAGGGTRFRRIDVTRHHRIGVPPVTAIRAPET